ncbi:hypothetical protein, partial [Teichococcus vastitatis]|uniref:hypothetical protein n=1 Tax=Teichococcus vastitatis TaxID=2307076 RepID=UPI003520DC26
IERMVAAVVTTEPRRNPSTGSAAIDPRNPLRQRLQELEAAVPVREMLRQDGRLEPASQGAAPPQPLLQAGALLRQLCEVFGVDPEGDEPAARAAPLRPEPPKAPAPPAKPPPPPPPLRVVASGAGSMATGRGKVRQPADRPAAPRPVRRQTKTEAPAARAGLTSGSFWALMDRWQVPDEPALALLGHAGGLTRKGTRPRFKLAPAEAEALQLMQGIDAGLSRLAQDPAQWLRQPLAAAPFTGARPLDWMLRHPGQGTRDLSQHLLQVALRASLNTGDEA